MAKISIGATWSAGLTNMFGFNELTFQVSKKWLQICFVTGIKGAIQNIFFGSSLFQLVNFDPADLRRQFRFRIQLIIPIEISGLQTATIRKMYPFDVTITEIRLVKYYILKQNIFKKTGCKSWKTDVAISKNTVCERWIVEGALIHFQSEWIFKAFPIENDAVMRCSVKIHFL